MLTGCSRGREAGPLPRELHGRFAKGVGSTKQVGSKERVKTVGKGLYEGQGEVHS